VSSGLRAKVEVCWDLF